MNSRNSGEERKSHTSRVRNLFRYLSDSGPSSVPSDPFIGSPFASSSRLNSPNIPPHSDDTHTRYPTGSNTTIVSSDSYRMPVDGPEGSNHAPSPAIPTATDPPCSACAMPMSGQFVRALGTIFHLECFRCQDCNVVVASKFFPIEGPDGRQHPLCERDYFRRLNLICAKCGSALRGAYITACNKKFHVKHFTCSVCPNLFGPQDSYYEHQGDVYCYFHYSTRFADKCVGCQTAILKQFVEINRNMKDECWHPECYMIHKFWNVRIAPKLVSIQAEPSDSAVSGEPNYKEVEALYDATTLRKNQVRIESLVIKIWTNLSSFEESSAACISDMLRHITNGMYLDSIRRAERFIVHVEVLFAVMDDLELSFMRVGAKGMSHVREAQMLCRKTVDLFTLLSRTQKAAPAPTPSDSDPNGPLTPASKQPGMTQELLALVTGLAHYLKILIRIALTGALKLDRDYGDRDSMNRFLESLHALGVEGGEPGANRMKVEVITGAGQMVTSSDKTGPSVSGV
ncbi:hypothetical protein FRC02_005646 [Tulasnella sp. 418]|nr:hypothetical protein FRC02_005646 [Tulasnella sp. 418]